jgi:hypothetical protein
LYQQRTNADAKTKPVIKKVMNSMFGKTLSKGYKTIKAKRVGNAEEYAARHMPRLHKVPGDGTVELERCYDKSFNYCFIGVAILSMARRLMNELFADCDRNGITVLLSNTDSVLIPTAGVAKLGHRISSELGEIKIEAASKEAIV